MHIPDAPHIELPMVVAEARKKHSHSQFQVCFPVVHTREAVLDSKTLRTPGAAFLPLRQKVGAEGVVGEEAQADTAVASLASSQFQSVASTWTRRAWPREAN